MTFLRCLIFGHRWHDPLEYTVGREPIEIVSWTCERCNRFTLAKAGDTPRPRQGSIPR